MSPAPPKPKNKRGGLFPKTLGQCVERATKPALKAYGLAGSRIVTDWEKIMGAEIAKHTVPQSVSFPAGKKIGGTLCIHVPGAFALQVQQLQPYILEKLASYFGYRAISRLQLVQTGMQKNPSPATPPAYTPQTIALAEKIKSESGYRPCGR